MTAKMAIPEQPVNPNSETCHPEITSEVLTKEKKQPWVQLISTLIETIETLSDHLNNRVTNTKQIFIAVAWIIAALTSLKLSLAVLNAINTIPFLGLFLEIIGIAYVSWFICRYLLSAANRQDLALQVKSFKEQIFGTIS
ncbi:hypothetical protein MC7420_812 [Coleofasciculus chthonoplastes PCC 7420]|uniref:Cyanobacterial aminoacyl-tRNA synthetase CAAD domain-containing protein n=2 Tax=Coleofasciculus TaxID=669368 RepID=B4VT28_9CYAN|nr:CAAD domain-containing protein [Coleofasciculus chthonoplastes]EDX74938.1 hypothetical protein MC7420_812 [Coleofasciculus chthonoplastes PCC 7420]